MIDKFYDIINLSCSNAYCFKSLPDCFIDRDPIELDGGTLNFHDLVSEISGKNASTLFHNIKMTEGRYLRYEGTISNREGRVVLFRQFDHKTGVEDSTWKDYVIVYNGFVYYPNAEPRKRWLYFATNPVTSGMAVMTTTIKKRSFKSWKQNTTT